MRQPRAVPIPFFSSSPAFFLEENLHLPTHLGKSLKLTSLLLKAVWKKTQPHQLDMTRLTLVGQFMDHTAVLVLNDFSFCAVIIQLD